MGVWKKKNILEHEGQVVGSVLKDSSIMVITNK